MRLTCLLIASLAFGCSNNNGNPNPGQDGGGGGQPDLAGAMLVAVTGHVNGGGNNANPPPVAGATVEVMGVSPGNSTTTAADGSYTLMVASGAPVFVRGSASGYHANERASGAPMAGTTIDLSLIADANYTMVATALSLTQDTSKGFLVAKFKESGSASPGYGATLSAAHGTSFTFNNNTPQNSDVTFGGNDSNLIFPNVVSGTTTVTAKPPTGKTCTPDQAITDWRIDPNTFTEVKFNCQ